MKIAYELTCLWLGDTYVDDPMAAVMRQFILDDDLPFDPSSKYPIRGTMRMAPLEPLLPFWPEERDDLIGCLIDDGQSMGILVSVLGVLDGIVRVTDSPELYPRHQRFVSIDPRNGNRRECRFEEEVVRIGSRWGEAG